MTSNNHNLKLSLLISAVMTLMSLTSCHTSRHANPLPEREDKTVLHTGDGNSTRRHIVEEAMTWVGTPYRTAGMDKGEGTDCSGMVMRVYEKATGMKLPRNSGKQAEFCKRIEAEDVRFGDLVFFATGKDRQKVSHVGILVDDSHFVHASSSKGVVVSDITSPYYRRTFLMFGRVPQLQAGIPDEPITQL